MGCDVVTNERRTCGAQTQYINCENFNTCVANGRIGRWKWRHEVSRVIASCAGWHDADGRMLSFSYYFEPRNGRIGEQWCTCRMGRRDGHSRTYPAMFLYMQSHGLRKLYGLPGTWVNLHMCVFFLWRCGPTRALAYSFLRFLDHTQPRITVGRTPLDAWSGRRRDLCLTTQNIYNKHPCPRWDSNSRSQQASGCRPTT